MTIETVISTDTDVEDAEHTQAILERADKLHQDREDGTDRPDWLPEEFATIEDLVAGYKQLKQPEEEETEQEQAEDEALDDETEETETEEEPRKGEPEGLDFENLTSEFIETGTLSDETLKGLEAAGIPRDVAEVHMAGLKAQAELTRMKAADSVGGGENLDAVLQWAGEALPEKEIDHINSLIADGNFDGYLLALQGVKAKYEAAYGSITGDELHGDTAFAGDAYASQEEMKADMRDPRYQVDEAWRARVAAKVARTRRSA